MLPITRYLFTEAYQNYTYQVPRLHVTWCHYIFTFWSTEVTRTHFVFLHLYNSELSQRRGTARSLHLPSPARTNAQLSYFSPGDGGTERAKLENMIFSLHSMRSMSIRDIQITKSVLEAQKSKNTVDTEQSDNDNSSTKWLTIPTIVLLIVGTIPSCTSDLYSSTFPFVFVQDFGIDSETSGQLSAVSNVISFILLSVFLKLSSSLSICITKAFQQ